MVRLKDKLLGSPGWEDATKSVFGMTDRGKERPDNEDYFRIVPEKSLYIVADGMGGHTAGEIASLNASQTVDNYLSHKKIIKIQGDDNKIREAIINSLVNAHSEILRMAKGNPNYKGMGCTIVVAIILGKSLYLGHVGDARAYVINDSGVKVLTTDHSFVMGLVEKGKMTMEEARLSPLRNRLNQAIGATADIKPGFGHHSLLEGDRIILCSDGLWDMLTEDQMYYAIMQDQPAKKICENLITMANDAGGHDNITAVVIIYKKEPLEVKTSDTGKFRDTSGEYSFVFSDSEE